ncbi:hypothetical protein AWC38_SpisGene14529 [Stylophora pistillata]|uniref:Uncharacterized protein n=1 Tax=Stylophora pistillata TaxID=50429 RepID=A0A2B4RXD8_STYPI|nr:hypothetical protein AWC38_SpisGene14529 [Stylophora pistillata]
MNSSISNFFTPKSGEEARLLPSAPTVAGILRPASSTSANSSCKTSRIFLRVSSNCRRLLQGVLQHGWVREFEGKSSRIQVLHDGTPSDLDLKGTTDPKVLVESIFVNPEALNLLRSEFTSNSVGASDSVGALKAPVTDQPHITQAGALKAQETARTKVNTVSADAEKGDNPPFAKQPRLSEHVEHGEDLEEDNYSSASRWQASEDLSAFIETFRKPLQLFDWKAICRRFPRPDVDAAYAPLLDEHLSSLIPGIKQADKDGRFLHDRILDPLGPMEFFLRAFE